MHHPPFQVGFAGMDAIALVDGADFIQLLQGFDIAHLIAGHVHRTISGSTAGLSFSMFKKHMSSNADGYDRHKYDAER